MYIGRDVDNISNVEKLDNITFDGSATYALEKSSVAYTPSGANNILISIDGVVQQGNFSVSTTNIVFDWSPTSSNTCDWILHFGTGLITTPADSSVTNAKLTSSVISSQSLVTADSSNDHVLIHDATDSALKKALYPSGFDVSSITGATALAETPADTDELIISDGGTLKRLDFSHLFNRPAFMANQAGAGQTITTATHTVLTFDTENFDTDGTFSSNRFTPTVAGYYWCFGNFSFSAPVADTNVTISLKKNGVSSQPWSWGVRETLAYSTEASIRTQALIYLDSDDYVELGIYHNSGIDKTTVADRTYFGAWRMNV